MKNLTLEELRQIKSETENSINKLIEDFEFKTGLKIESITLNTPFYEIGEKGSKWQLDVKIKL